MFTGIIQTVGRVRSVEQKAGDVELSIEAAQLGLENVSIGDSICVSGCCLTVTQKSESTFCADVSRETLAVTTIGAWQAGQRVNLEKALLAGQPLGGHYVTGHIDAVGKVVSIRSDARSHRIQFEVPAALSRYVARKGSICIDGTSLTVNEVEGSRFDVNLIPHTLAATISNDYRIGTLVNLEVDIIARYLERLIHPEPAPGASV
jgi:riboflavin synthase